MELVEEAEVRGVDRGDAGVAGTCARLMKASERIDLAEQRMTI